MTHFKVTSVSTKIRVTDTGSFRKTFTNLLTEEKKLEERRIKQGKLYTKRKDESKERPRSRGRSSRHRVSPSTSTDFRLGSDSTCSSRLKNSESKTSNETIEKLELRKLRKEEKLLEQYKNKLALYVVDELGSAVSTRDRESFDYDSDSEVGLSIDAEETKLPEQGSLEKTTEIVRSLFYQVSSKVPEDICRQLRFKADVYFYELLSIHFGSSAMRNFVQNSLLPKCKKLYSIETFPALFAMILYRYHLKFDDSSKAEWLIRFNIFLKGTHQIMWHDVNQKTRRLYSLFSYIRSKLKSSKFLNKDSISEQREKLVAVLCKFYYYYCSSKPNQVLKFLKDLNISLSTFIRHCLESITSMQSHPALQVHYLSSLAKLKQLVNFEKLENHMKNQIHATLNSLSIIGVPYKPVKEVRIAANKCLNTFFPSSRWSRSIVNSMFLFSRAEFYTNEAQTLYLYATDMIITFTPLRFFYSGRRA